MAIFLIVIVFLFFGVLSDIGVWLDQRDASYKERLIVLLILVFIIFLLCVLITILASFA